jgi:predicted DNA-binding transcriptional regulator YafY
MAKVVKLSSEIDRYAPAERLLQLGLLLSEARGGLTLDEMAQSLGVTRRTVERLRNKLDHITSGGLTVTTDDANRKRWALSVGRLSALATPNLEELAELKLAIASLRRQGAEREADVLGQLALKLESTMPRPTLRRLEPDIEALLEASGSLVRPGPRISIDPPVIAAIRRAILESKQVRLSYRRRDTNQLSRPVLCPYGLLTGSRGYLVGFNPHPEVQAYRLYALSNVEVVEVLDQAFTRDPAFDLQRFAARSFGVFWDGKQYEVEWRFKPSAAEDARRFLFHPDQVVTNLPDGSVLIQFTASGLTEMAWHLFRWGEHVEILKPDDLKQRYRECLQEACSALSDARETGVGPIRPEFTVNEFS